MIIICDVDGVIADLHTPWLHRYNTRSGDKLTKEGITSWSVSDFVLPAWRDRMFEILHEPDLYNDVFPINGALPAIQELQRKHRVVFTTSCVKGMADQKWEWLEREGFLPKRYSHKDLVITADKSLLFGDLIIDDSFEHCKDFHGDALLFDQPWNRKAFTDPWCRRVGGWIDVLANVENKEATRA